MDPKESPENWLDQQNEAVLACKRCPRLRAYCHEIATVRRAAFRESIYHALPVPNFGTKEARLLVVGLAPAAHGANRTGRMFTGDRSGQWLYRALHKAGFANQAESQTTDDRLKLNDCLITAVCHCAPPKNKPLPEEISHCSRYLLQTLQFTPWKVAIALGQIAWQEIHRNLGMKTPKFAHMAESKITKNKIVIASYHPSQQNTFTGKLTELMFDAVFKKAKTILNS